MKLYTTFIANVVCNCNISYSVDILLSAGYVFKRTNLANLLRLKIIPIWITKLLVFVILLELGVSLACAPERLRVYLSQLYSHILGKELTGQIVEN